jgi:hypothetical protein
MGLFFRSVLVLGATVQIVVLILALYAVLADRREES